MLLPCLIVKARMARTGNKMWTVILSICVLIPMQSQAHATQQINDMIPTVFSIRVRSELFGNVPHTSCRHFVTNN
jgi:hypothetical protein